MVAMRVLMGTGELLAHALAIEYEAAERYEELGQRMRDLGNDAVADLFLGLAGKEHEHERQLKRRATGVRLPPLERGRYAWIDEEGAPETAAHNLVLGLLTPYSALRIALDAEKRAQSFFETASECALDPEVQKLAEELASEEGEHAERVKSLLKDTPNPVIDWTVVFG